MYGEDYSAATDFFCGIITPEDVLPVAALVNRISRASTDARRYLEKRCRDANELEEFFKDNEHLFYVENKRVTLHDDRLINVSEKTVMYFKEKLKSYDKPVNYIELKITLLEHAPQAISYFITRFYPGKEIKHFFKRRPDIFSLHNHRRVFLIEVESVAFYRDKLKARNGQKQYFSSLRGRIGQADPHIQSYINRYFLDDDFQNFLLRNNDVFKLDENGFVSLQPSK